MNNLNSVDLANPVLSHTFRNEVKFQKALKDLINTYSIENDSNTPDWMIADYLVSCLKNWNYNILRREGWFGRGPNAVPLADEPAQTNETLSTQDNDDTTKQNKL